MPSASDSPSCTAPYLPGISPIAGSAVEAAAQSWPAGEQAPLESPSGGDAIGLHGSTWPAVAPPGIAGGQRSMPAKIKFP